MLPQNIFRLLVYLAVAVYLNSANADPTQENKAEAAHGTWTSGLNVKIDSNDESRCAKIIPGCAFPSRNACNGGAETLFFMYKWSGSTDECGCFESKHDL
jgi:hypothetical protein